MLFRIELFAVVAGHLAMMLRVERLWLVRHKNPF
jgi:hypothetical protein